MILQEYCIDHGEIWFVKLDAHIPLGLCAVGNTKGKVYIYPIGPTIPKGIEVDKEENKARRVSTFRLLQTTLF
jgi:hypothetical protein